MKKMLIYTGHSEVVGGDVKFIVDYLNCIDRKRFDVKLYTDRFCHFEKLTAKWLKSRIVVHYLPTLPVVFANYFPLNILNRLERVHHFRKILNRPLVGGKTAKHLIDYFIRTLTLYEYRISVWNFFVFLKLFIQNKEFDVFFFNNGGYPGKSAGIVACVAAKVCRVPNIVMVFHNIPVNRRPLSLFDYLLDKLLERSVDSIISVSTTLTMDLINKRKFSSRKIVTIHCGLEDIASVDESELTTLRTSLGISYDHKIILIAGNLNETRKGHAFLLRSLAILKEKYTQFVLLIVGVATVERQRELVTMSESLRLQQHVIFLGQRFDIAQLNALADIVVVPSVGSEATPYTIKEGSRAGKPVITTNMGGCAEGVRDGVTGFVVNANNDQQLAEKIMLLLLNSDLAKKMGDSGRLFFLDQFELRKKAHEIDLVLDKVSGKPGA